MKQKIILLSFFLCLHYLSQAQKQSIEVSGRVTDSITGEPVSHATISIKGEGDKAYTDDKGNFRFKATARYPIILRITYGGFESKEVEFIKEGSELSITLKAGGTMEDVVVTSILKKRSSFMDAPVSVGYIPLKQIENSPSPDPTSILGTQTGVDLTAAGMLFVTAATRGFNGSGNSRVNQFVDGMDNQAPGLNFFLGMFAMFPSMDFESMELLQGASSALYGSGGMNGTILINSKNPFKYTGLDIIARTGIMHVDKQQRNAASPYYDYSLRWAKSFKDKFAFKICAQYISGHDWLANDSTNYKRTGNTGNTIPGTRASDPNYDGVNVYGDETKLDLRMFLAGSLPPGHPLLKDPILVSRTGYDEKDIIDPITKNIKLSGAFHYKLTNKLEAQLMGYWATGNTVYTGNNRYVLKGIKIGQYKVELRHSDWFLRSYTTQEDAGEAYSATVTSQYFNEGWKRSFDKTDLPGSWYPQYTGAFMQAVMAGAPIGQAHQIARSFADQGRPMAGSEQFKQIFEKVRKTPISEGGGLFLEKSQLWMTEGQYDLSNKIKFADLIIGGNWKKYVLDSHGTLFIDTLKPITFNEFGTYAQIGKKLFNDLLSLTFSGRYDKNGDFKGKFTPRATALVKLAKNQNLRFSYQTAYRFPTTQQKYIRLDVGEYTLLGGLPWVMDYMDVGHHPVLEITPTGPQPYTYKEFKPESMSSFEMGYKAFIKKKLLIDGYAYWGKYRDFLGRNVLIQPTTGKVFSTVVNSSTEVKTYGFGGGIDYSMRGNYHLFANAYSDVITDVPSGFLSFFNTPRYRMNAGFGNDGFGKNKRMGFNIVWHWQDAFFSDGDLASGAVHAFNTIDAVVSYRVAKTTVVKLGGSNILNHYYQNAYGNPKVGGLYYASIGFSLHK